MDAVHTFYDAIYNWFLTLFLIVNSLTKFSPWFNKQLKNILFFSSVFSDDHFNLDTTSLSIKSFDLPNNINFTVENVYKYLSDLHGNWIVEPDGSSGEYFCQLKNVIAFPSDSF